ncbi:MAG: amino acid ABC transporter ATP-binding protein, partial [Oceanibulbus sp.]|nr:amino acid ABC transporter ATP-binding protein [Sulfitobacter sp.]
LVEEGSAEGEALSSDASLRDALSACLWSGRGAVPVAEDGVPLGRVTLDAIRARAGQHA